MADINVERKSSGGGRSFLPWILGLIVLALLIWGLSRLFGGKDDDVNTTVPADTTVTTTTTTETAPMAPAGATMPMDSAATTGTAMPMDSGAAGTSPQLTGAVDSAGGDTVPEGRLGNP